VVSGILEGKFVLVSGGNQGIGRGIALRLAHDGADVAIVYRKDQAEAEQVVRELEAGKRRAIAIRADLSQVRDTQRAVDEAASAFGRIDILVNNAGLEKNAAFWDVTEQDYDAVMNVNLKGLFFLTQAMVRHLRQARRGGKIINISSVHEELPFPHFTSYCASKGGVKMITRNLAIELAPLGITVNSVAPGAIKTPINRALLEDPAKLNAVLGNIPLHRLGEPADVAGVVAFLASPDADYITGASIFVDGGLTWNYQEQ
jgi:glucose 1-dehydrogenase